MQHAHARVTRREKGGGRREKTVERRECHGRVESVISATEGDDVACFPFSDRPITREQPRKPLVALASSSSSFSSPSFDVIGCQPIVFHRRTLASAMLIPKKHRNEVYRSLFKGMVIFTVDLRYRNANITHTSYDHYYHHHTRLCSAE
jgi:hypothetical protein